MATRHHALDDLHPIALPVQRVSGLTGPSPRRPRVLLYTERGLALDAAARASDARADRESTMRLHALDVREGRA